MYVVLRYVSINNIVRVQQQQQSTINYVHKMCTSLQKPLTSELIEKKGVIQRYKRWKGCMDSKCWRRHTANKL